MSSDILMIGHMERWKDQRATDLLIGKECRVEWRCPAEGDALPQELERYAGAVILGGPQNVADAERPEHAYLVDEMRLIERWLGTGKPLLGICLGSQLMAATLGARVAPHPEGRAEIGYYPLEATQEGRGILPDGLVVYHWHYQTFDLPHGAERLAARPHFRNQAFRYGERVFGLQFHPEATPPQIEAWTRLYEKDLDAPGAHPRQRQLADLPRYDAPLAAWFDGFLAKWLGDSDTQSSSDRVSPAATDL